jgi:hypothetical protein
MITRLSLTATLVLLITSGTSWAQFVVTDPVTTARNAIIAQLHVDVLAKMVQQRDRLVRMARRLSELVRLDRYRSIDVPLWRIHDAETRLFANDFHSALNYGDAAGRAYVSVARARLGLPDLVPDGPARRAIEAALATLDAADSTVLTAVHQAGLLRFNGRSEGRAIDALETDVLDPSVEQGATAVVGKISGAHLLETRQKQARLQFLTGVLEQLLLDNKRARDAEVAVMNMQLQRLSAGRIPGTAITRGAADDLRGWRQP